MWSLNILDTNQIDYITKTNISYRNIPNFDLIIRNHNEKAKSDLCWQEKEQDQIGQNADPRQHHTPMSTGCKFPP